MEPQGRKAEKGAKKLARSNKWLCSCWHARVPGKGRRWSWAWHLPFCGPGVTIALFILKEELELKDCRHGRILDYIHVLEISINGDIYSHSCASLCGLEQVISPLHMITINSVWGKRWNAIKWLQLTEQFLYELTQGLERTCVIICRFHDLCCNYSQDAVVAQISH